jgi:general secretion pathway protein K
MNLLFCQSKFRRGLWARKRLFWRGDLFYRRAVDLEALTEQKLDYFHTRSGQTTSTVEIANRANPYSASLRSFSPVLCRQNGGFALIIVLWTLVLIAFIVVQITASGKTEIRIASNLIANAVAQAAADGAIYEGISNLSLPQPDQRWPVDGSKRELLIGQTRVALRLEDEAWWINPNWASPALLEALHRATGIDPESAHRLAYAISEWVGTTPAPRAPNVSLVDYQAAGLDYGPPGAPLETLDELGRVMGMTPATIAAIRPHLTLFGPAQPNPATPDPIVAAALVETAQATTAPSAAQPPPDMLTTRITATAIDAHDAHVTRSAIVRVGAMLPRCYEILAWRDRF